MTWASVGVATTVAVYVGILLGSLRSAAPDTSLSVPPERGWHAALTYLVLAAVATPLLFLVGGLLTIARPVRPFAVGVVLGTAASAVVVSGLALLVIIPASPK